MAEIVLYHHVLGLTKGIHKFADILRQNGHIVHAPDLFGGRLFPTIEEGLAYVEDVGINEISARGATAVEELPSGLVYAGSSLGVVPAQKLAQTRDGARGALLFSSCVPAAMFGTPWPVNLPAQIHGMEDDRYFVGDGDIEAARELVALTDQTTLYLYSGDQHLFFDSSLTSYDAQATKLLLQRVLDFLGRLDLGRLDH